MTALLVLSLLAVAGLTLALAAERDRAAAAEDARDYWRNLAGRLFADMHESRQEAQHWRDRHGLVSDVCRRNVVSRN